MEGDKSPRRQNDINVYASNNRAWAKWQDCRKGLSKIYKIHITQDELKHSA